MSRLACLGGVLFAAALAGPMTASASASLSLTFSGVATPWSSSDLTPFRTDIPPSSVSFVGEPVSIALTIAGDPGRLYVSGFSAQWSSQTYTLPYITGLSGPGFPDDPLHEGWSGFMSVVNLTDAGGEIRLYPTLGYMSDTDGSAGLDIHFTYGEPHDPYAGITGGGTAYSDVSDHYDPTIGPYNGGANVTFNLSAMTRSGAIPEPSCWALMLMGFGGLGAACRRRVAAPDPLRAGRRT